MKKRSKKIKRLLFILLGLALICAAALIVYTPILIELNGDSEISICYGETFEDPGASLKIGNRLIPADKEIDSSGLGSSVLTYRFLKETVTRTVNVTDQKRPEITLKGQDKMYVTQHSVFTEPGYEACDEIDGDISANVQISGEVDTETPGEYTITYLVSDAAGNMARERRSVFVQEGNAFTMDLLEFDLYPFYSDVICKEVPFNEEKYGELYFFGDSFIGNMGYYDCIPMSRTWYKPSASTEYDELAGLIIQDGWASSGTTFYDMLAYRQPKYLLVLCNSDWTGRWTPEYLYQSCDAAYAHMKELSPDTTFIICSLMPLHEDFNRADWVSEMGFNRNDRVNKMNAYMCELCRKYGFKFMNAAECVKNPANGACYIDYIDYDYIHLSRAGFAQVGEYIRAHLDF